MKEQPRNILVLGSGGREHALCWHLKNAGHSVSCAPGSDAIAKLVPVFSFSDFEELSLKISEKNVSEVIVGPEKYLAEGVADTLQAKKIQVFGPTKSAARLESDKAWAKDFCVRHKIPTAQAAVVRSPAEARSEIKKFKAPYVIKASGLAAGKGVWIGDDPEAAIAFAETALQSHSSVVCEEFLAGEEVSYFVLIDGKNRLFLGAAQDHKRLLENDEGPNTGGMGAYTPLPQLTAQLQKAIEERVIEPTLKGLQKDGIFYRGFLFVGLMVADGNPYVLEYNCRMGDPETQALMMSLRSSLSDLIESLKNPGAKTLPPAEHHEGISMNVVVASRGYPDDPMQGFVLSKIDDCPDECVVFHSGTKWSGKDWTASGGRLFSVNTRQKNLLDCQQKIYPWIESFSFLKNITYRKDVGVKAYRHLTSKKGSSHA